MDACQELFDFDALRKSLVAQAGTSSLGEGERWVVCKVSWELECPGYGVCMHVGEGNREKSQ